MKPFQGLLVLFSLILAVPGAAQTRGALHGSVEEGNVYISPTGLFKVPIPVLPELGGVINDTPNAVVFRDSFTENLSIGAFRMNRGQRWEFETRDRRDYLVLFFNEVMLPDFAENVPGAQVESAEFMPGIHGGTMIAYVLLPEGSLFSNQNRLFQAAREMEVAKRANMIFVKDGHVVVVSSELAERVTQKRTFSRTAQEENEILRKRLLEFVGRIVFLSDATQATQS
jgi:hypothetical protein